MVLKELNLDEVREYLSHCGPDTRIYLGADSERKNINGRWYADYLLAVVIHINGNNGCKVFGEVTREEVFDKNLARPRLRLMTEVFKISELFLKMQDFIADFEVEVHLDLNPNPMYGSSCAVKEAIGYIKGTCGFDPVVKPDAWAGSIAADRLYFMLNGR